MPNLLTWKNGRVMISGKFAFLFQSRFGIEPEILEEWVNRYLPAGSFLRAYHALSAYKLATGTV